LSRFLSPLIELRHSLPADASIDDLIVANVKKTVHTVCESEVSPREYENPCVETEG
jgi:hypothetical protein